MGVVALETGGHLAHECNEYVQEYTNYPEKYSQIPIRQNKASPNPKTCRPLWVSESKPTPTREIVLDNCIGSGTTAIAALNTGRFFIGIEKEEKYVEIARKRIAEHMQQLSIV